jgi:glycosyltransferase involved in cell wall biosynthesis
MNYIANQSSFGNPYYDGLRVHGTLHNPGRDYQGAESNPFEFFRMIAEKQDIELLNKHPQLEKLKDIENRWNSATQEEKRFANQILRPFMENFLDDFSSGDVRTYNITMTPIVASRLNPKNMTVGTVSVNYGKEMKSSSTPDIAQYLTRRLAEINTIDITNGSTPANLRLNDASADFCQKGEINGLTLLKEGFTPYEYHSVIENGKLVSDNIKEVLAAKKANTKWLLDSLSTAYNAGGKNAVLKMFFSDNQISKGATVLGHLSSYKDGDMLFMGWGRPDRQKGYPSTFQAFLDFLKDTNVPQETKQHTKLIVGAGVWDEYARDYSWIKDIIKQIEELDGGIYKGNACYVNGFFPNRLVGCATHSIFTSRYEPCGITPLESFASGTPVVSTRTGGAPDFVAPTRGYLTRNAYLRSVEELKIDTSKFAGKSGDEIGNIVDTQRMFANASEVRECLISATTDYGKETYADLVRDAITQKMDWHENGAFNGGHSANERYMTEVFEINKGLEARNTTPLRRLVGDKFGIADTIQEASSRIRNKWVQGMFIVGAGIATLGIASYLYLKRDKTSQAPQDKLNKLA